MSNPPMKVKFETGMDSDSQEEAEVLVSSLLNPASQGYSVSQAKTSESRLELEFIPPSAKTNSDTHLNSSNSSSDDKVFDPSTSRFERARRRIARSCRKKLLKRRLPPLQWLPTCTLSTVFHDCMAGFTVALTAIPQGIAYGAVAGVPVEYGLYTAFAGPFIYTLLGSVSQITMGPTAVMALMTQEYVQKGGAAYAVVLAFLAGCFELLAGLLNLGFLMDFISGPVISGFCSAAAVSVIVSQIKTILGLRFRGSSFIKAFPGIFQHYQSIRLWDALLGFSFIVFLIVMKNLNDLKKKFNSGCCLHNPHVERFLWFLSTCRNALAVIIGCIMAYLFDIYGCQPFYLTGEIKSGIPSLSIPPFNFWRPADTPIGDDVNLSSNLTDGILANHTETVTFDVILKDLGFGLVLVPVVAILEQVAIAKAFSNGGRTDSTQEMIALGSGSIVCSFFGCIPLTASFSRSSVLNASGGKTQLASFFNGCVILLALAFLMPTFYYIPKSVLGAVIITACYPMIEYHEIPAMWKGRRVELIPLFTTFLCCLLINMEYGILIGAQIHLLLLVFESTRSKSTTLRYKNGNEERVVFKADRNLYFPSVERFRNSLSKASGEDSVKRTIVVDLGRVTQVDHTSLKMLKSTMQIWDKKAETYFLANVDPKVRKTLNSMIPNSHAIMQRSILPSTDTTISLDADEYVRSGELR